MDSADLPDKWRIPLDSGFSIFPVQPRDKKPIGPWAQHQNSRSTLSQITSWNERHADCNVGIATGGVSGIIVLDLDSPEAIAEAERLGLPDTVAVETGKGRHVYFRHSGERTSNRAGLRPGMDLRGDGGYVVAPGSLHTTGKVYSWIKSPADTPLADAPAWVLASPKRRARGGPDGAIAKEVKAVANGREGTRNDQLNNSAFKLAQLAAGGQLDWEEAEKRLHAAAVAAGLEDAEIAATIESGRRAGAASPKREKPAPISQNEVALEFAQRAPGDWLYGHSTGRWLVWDEQCYVEDKIGRARDVLREIAVELGDGQPRSFSWSFVLGAEGFARDLPEIAVKTDDLDRAAYLLATPAGTIDLQTGQLRPADRLDKITMLAGVISQIGEPTLWLTFLNQALGEDQETIRFLQRWCGYCLTGDTREQALLLLQWAGGNGKSVLINLLYFVLGDYAKVAALDTFTSSRMERHSTELAMLRGARLVTASETEADKAWDEVRIKAVTGGEPITARFMRQDNFTFRPNFKLLVASNHHPRLRDCGDAMRRRLKIVPFTTKPAKPDLQLEEKLKAEAGRILQWMVEGSLAWQAEGLGGSAKVGAVTTEYFDDQDTFAQWLVEECAPDLSHSERSAVLFDSWRDFAVARGEIPGSERTFSDRMKAKGLGKVRSNGIRWQGIRLRGTTELRAVA